nr:paired amphipathic helix protein Sin3-like 4 isoform X2 [Tanacetum cinerariifolium]
MKLSTKLPDIVLDLEKIKTAQANEIADLKKRVKKLERKRRSRTLRMNLFKIGTSRRRSLGEDDASKHGRKFKQGSIFKENEYQVYGRIVGIKILFSAVEVTAASYGFYCWLRSPRSIQLGSINTLMTMDAHTYLKKIKETFKDQKEKYDEFRDAMKYFKAHRVDTSSTIARVRRLFEGFPDLILGFNTLLTKEHEITIDEPQAKKPVEFDEAFQFVNKIKTRFEGDERSYSSFLSIFSMYNNNIKSVSEVHQKVDALLHNQPDLLKEFANFLPSRQYVHSSMNRNHNRSLHVGAIRPRHPKKKRAVSVEMLHHHREDGFNRHTKKEKISREDREHRSQDRGFDHHGTNRLTYNRKPASALEDYAPSLKKLEDSVAELFHQAMRDEVLCLREKVNDILGAYPDLMEEVNGFIDRSDSTGSLWSGNLPESVKADNEDQDRERDVKIVSVIKDEYQAKPIHELDLSHCEQCGPSYRRLPKDKNASLALPVILTRLKQKQVDWERLETTFSGCRGLIAPACLAGYVKEQQAKRRCTLEDSAPSLKKLENSVAELFHQAMRDEVLCLSEKVEKTLNDSDIYRKLLGWIVHYDTRNITRSNPENLVNDILAYPDLMEEDNGFIGRSDSAGSLWSGNLPESVKADNEDQDRERDVKTVSVIKDEYQAKPIHELDLSDCEQCGPSYRRLPKDYPIPKVSGRTKIGAKVLNDHWVSVNSGSDDYSFKHMRKNQYEESLFQCEDDRCIERLYGDNGLDVLDVLKKHASLALPVILTRLKQKQEDWESKDATLLDDINLLSRLFNCCRKPLIL